MTTSTSPVAYDDCYDMFDRALKARQGIRVGVPDSGAGHQLFVRLNYARTMDRKRNADIFPHDDPKHGVSDYDVLIVRKPKEEDGQWWLVIEKRTVTGIIEELGEDATAPSGGAAPASNFEPEPVRRRLV